MKTATLLPSIIPKAAGKSEIEGLSKSESEHANMDGEKQFADLLNVGEAMFMEQGLEIPKSPATAPDDSHQKDIERDLGPQRNAVFEGLQLAERNIDLDTQAYAPPMSKKLARPVLPENAHASTQTVLNTAGPLTPTANTITKQSTLPSVKVQPSPVDRSNLVMDLRQEYVGQKSPAIEAKTVDASLFVELDISNPEVGLPAARIHADSALVLSPAQEVQSDVIGSGQSGNPQHISPKVALSASTPSTPIQQAVPRKLVGNAEQSKTIAVDPLLNEVRAIPRSPDANLDFGTGDEVELLAPNIKSTVSVTRQESHFAPITSIPVMQQLVNPLNNELVSLTSEWNARPARPDEDLSLHSAKPMVKYLQIELKPQDLGTVSVRMSLRGDTLDIKIDAVRSDTASILRRQQDALNQMLSSAGYKLEAVTVQFVESSPLAALGNQTDTNSQQNLQQDTQRGPSSDTAAQGRDASSEGSNSGNREERRAQHGMQPTTDEIVRPHASDDSVYL